MSATFIDYKGTKITVRDEDFYVEEIGAKPTLKAMKDAIDAYKRGERQLRIPALKIEGTGWRSSKPKIVEVTITSLAERQDSRYGRGSQEAFVVDKDKNREKRNINSLYPVSARAGLDRYIELKVAAIAAEAAAEKHLEDIDGFTEETAMAAKEALTNAGK